jgi:hypothetical protein
MMRSTTAEVTFRHSFDLKAVGSGLPAGTYRVDFEEEQIDGLSFLAYRRLATFIRIPATGHGSTSAQLFLVDPKELIEAQERDAAAGPPGG